MSNVARSSTTKEFTAGSVVIAGLPHSRTAARESAPGGLPYFRLCGLRVLTPVIAARFSAITCPSFHDDGAQAVGGTLVSSHYDHDVRAHRNSPLLLTEFPRPG